MLEIMRKLGDGNAAAAAAPEKMFLPKVGGVTVLVDKYDTRDFTKRNTENRKAFVDASVARVKRDLATAEVDTAQLTIANLQSWD